MRKPRRKGTQDEIKEEEQQPQLQPQPQQRPKRNIVLAQWMKGIFKKKPKEIAASTPTPTPQKSPDKESKLLFMRNSLHSIFKPKIKKSELNVKDIGLIHGLEVKDLKKRYAVTGVNVVILEMMVADYKRGRFASSPTSEKAKLNKAKLNEIITEYNDVVRKKDLEEIQKNAQDLKKKFAMPQAQVFKLDNIVKDLHDGNGSHLDIATVLLDPKKLTKEQLDTLIKEYEESTQVKPKKKKMPKFFGNLLSKRNS